MLTALLPTLVHTSNHRTITKVEVYIARPAGLIKAKLFAIISNSSPAGLQNYLPVCDLFSSTLANNQVIFHVSFFHGCSFNGIYLPLSNSYL